MRDVVPCSTSWKPTRWDSVAENRLMGMLTSPKLIDPFQIERAISVAYIHGACQRAAREGAPRARSRAGYVCKGFACSGPPAGRRRGHRFVSLSLRFGVGVVSRVT